MLSFELKVNGLEQFIKKLDTKPEVARGINKGIKKIIFFMEGEAIPFTPVDKGILRNSYRQKFSNLFGRLFNIRDYGVFVHEGTRFIKANPFMTKALNKSEGKIEIIMNNEINKSLSILH